MNGGNIELVNGIINQLITGHHLVHITTMKLLSLSIVLSLYFCWGMNIWLGDEHRMFVHQKKSLTGL